MSKRFTVAIVGATGAVGSEMLRVLEDRDFPVRELLPLATGESDGDFVDFHDDQVMVQTLSSDSFEGIDIAFFCAGDDVSREFCPVASSAGAICIDLSKAWRTNPDVPLVVPEINSADIALYSRKRIVANPGAATIMMAFPLNVLRAETRIRRIVVTTFQAVSGNGEKGIDELRIQTGELLNGRPAESKLFPHQIAFNCFPQIGSFLSNGYSDEEAGVLNETRKIFGDDTVGMTVTAVRAPLFYAHSASVNVEFENPLSVERARGLLEEASGVTVVDDLSEETYPMPVDAAGQDDVLVGRIRQDESCPNALNMWIVADNLRKGGAVNAVQIAEFLVADYL